MKDVVSQAFVKARQAELTATQTAVYVYIVSQWQQQGCEDEVEIPASDMAWMCSARTLRRACSVLTDKGLVSTRPGRGKGHCTTYTVHPFEEMPEGTEKKKTGIRPKAKVKPAINTEKECKPKVASEQPLLFKHEKRKSVPRPKQEDTPPKMDEVMAVCMAKGMSRKEAEEFFYYYDAQGWVTSSGQKIKRIDSMVN